MTGIDWATCQVVKLDYSADPWRIVTADGRQITHPRPYPGCEGMSPDDPHYLPPFDALLAFPRKRDAVDALSLLAEFCQ